MSEFKFIDRGRKSTTLLIPGWASDYRIFDTVDLDSNYLMPVRLSPFNFHKDLLKALTRNNLKGISIIGWSMGSFLASDFLSKYKDIVRKLILVSARKRYTKEEIGAVRISVKKNRVAFIYKFYKDCFCAHEKQAFKWFKGNLLKDYFEQMDTDMLLDGLDYISQSAIKPELFAGIKVKLIHGKEDRIAPMDEAIELKGNLPQAEFIIMENSGHMPFLNSQFKRVVNDQFMSHR